MKCALYEDIIFEVSDNFKLNEVNIKKSIRNPHIYLDTINHSLDIEYRPDQYFSEFKSKFLTVNKDSKIRGEVKFPLIKPTIINESEIILNTYKARNLREFMFSMMLVNGDYDKLELLDFENGVCILIPVDPKSFLPFNSQEEVQEFINSNTDRLYIRNLKSLVNLIGVDLFKENNYTSRNTVPYGLLPDFYLSEPMIIGGLIIELEKQFPDIQFYNRVNSRDNMNKVDEVVYYDADIHLERSNRFNSNVISDPKYGKVKKSTIPVMFRYETTSAKRFMERRHQTLILNFLNRVTTYKFDIDANKYYNYTDDGFSCGVNWDGVPLEGDIRYSQDNSERTIYSFEMRCDIIGCIIEKNSEPHRIDEVINFIYVKSSEDKDNKLARLEEYVK